MKKIFIAAIVFGVIISFCISSIFIVSLYSSQLNEIRIIPIKGAIYMNPSTGFGMSGESYADDIADKIAKADKDSTVKAIILEIDSPGGTVVASEEVSRAVLEAKKPVISWIRETGASGAYWVACSADSIVAHPFSVVGSFGVTSSYIQFAGLMDKYGVQYERIVSGEYKDIGSPFKNLTYSEKIILQDMVNELNEEFVAHISSERDIPLEEVRMLADGRLFLGTTAKEYNLVDVLGSETEAIEEAKRLAGITKEPFFVSKEQPAKLSLLSYFFGSSSISNLISSTAFDNIEEKDSRILFYY